MLGLLSPSDQDIQSFGDWFGSGIPIVSMRARTNRKLNSAVLYPVNSG